MYRPERLIAFVLDDQRYALYLLNDIMGTSFEPIFAAARQGDVRHSQASAILARGLLGHEPKVSLREGLERTVDWFKRHG